MDWKTWITSYDNYIKIPGIIVYQDRYGDVYGVSGTAPDQEFLNRNDWTELHKNNE